ncbi:MAG: DegQ family serine endoprotease [Alphaproteobacteria bacterium]
MNIQASLPLQRPWQHLSRLGSAFLIIALVSVGTTANAQAKPAPDGFADLAEKLLPAVVNISTTQIVKDTGTPEFSFPPGSPFEEFFKEFLDRQQNKGKPRRTTSLGSGFIIDPSGLIVTNNHVINEAEEITVILNDNTNLKAKILGRDTKTDLALLKVDASKPLSAVAFGDSDKVRIGDWVLAIGNPFGLGSSVTSGIVSALARDINSGQYDEFIQTDASINRGNSGGPMFNMAGEVIGINTAILSPSGGSVGIGFAVPSNLAKQVIDQLRQFGKTRRGWLGVRIQEVTPEISESLGLGKPRGALVASVTPGGPAEAAKILPGDIVLKFNGHDITEMRRLPRVVAETSVGSEVPIDVWRAEKVLSLRVKVGELPDEPEEASAAGDKKGSGSNPTSPTVGTVTVLGLTLAPISNEARQKYGIDSKTAGVLITAVDAKSSASEKGIRPGDVITEVAQEEVKTPADAAKQVKASKDSGRKSILLLVDRGGDLRFIALKIE